MIIKPYLCSWSFDKQGSIYSKESFSNLEKDYVKDLIDRRLDFLLEVLEILYDEQILLVDNVNLRIFEVEYHYAVTSSELSVFTQRIKTEIKQAFTKNKMPFSCVLRGRTIIKNKTEEKEYKGLIDLSYSLLRNGFELNNHSDVWTPMDLNDNYQIDMAIQNGPRLERSLARIKALANYSFICPDEGEYGDEELPQLGFRVLTYQGDITELDDFPKERKEEVTRFIGRYIV